MKAAALGDFLKNNDVNFTRAYASTYQRSYETAKGILSSQTSPPDLKHDSRIKERVRIDSLVS
jgi:broad specificity phosphatase PhoE